MATRTPKKAVTQKAAAKTRTCAVNSQRWSVLIPDQPECTRPLAKPTAALCQRHEKMLPAGWRKLDAARPRLRPNGAAKAAKPKRLSAKAGRGQYSAIVARLEGEGATTSDAQAAADVEVHERGICDPKTCPLHLAAKPKRSKPPVSA